MGSCREILTLQLGTYANYVGAHWWSLQEMGFNFSSGESSGICHDVLFREGLSMKGEVTFTPRVLCVENTSRLAPVPTLQDDFANASIDESLETVGTETQKPHQFIQDLDAGIDTNKCNYEFEKTSRGWGDFLRTRLHPRSVLPNCSTCDDELEDRIRMYIEECDNLQGFQIISDATQYYSGIQSFLDDEYSSKFRLAVPVIPAFSEKVGKIEIHSRTLQIFRNFTEYSMFSNLTVPLSCIAELSGKIDTFRAFTHLTFDGTKAYESSAILAAFLDTVSMSYRSSGNRNMMSDTLAGLTSRGWKFSCASLSLPFGLAPSMTLQQFLEDRNDDVDLWSSLTPGSDTQDSWFQLLSLRGFPASDGEILLKYMQYLSSTVTSCVSNPSAISTLQPFPKIFSPHVSMKGSVDITANRADGFEVMSVPTLGGLHIAPAVGEMLNNLTDSSAKIDLRQIPRNDIELDNHRDSISQMKSLAKDHSFLMDFE